MSKHDWFEAYEQLESELGREPSGEEVNEAVIDRISTLYDRAKDERKYGDGSSE